MRQQKLSKASTKWLVVGAASVLAVTQGACVTGTQFRSAALPSVESGVNQVLDGLVSGFFAAIEVESSSDSNNAG